MQPLLLLHGAIGSRVQMYPVAEELKEYFDVNTLNFSGHGGEEISGEFTIELFSENVLAYMKQNNLLRVNIFGYSMGGYVAMHLAKNNPDVVNSIVTLATKFKWSEEIAAKETSMLNPSVIETKIPAFAETLKQRHAPQDWKMVLDKTSSMLRVLGSENRAAEYYSDIQCPVMLMLGDRDKMVTIDETIEVYKKLPHGSMAILPGTSHPIEQVDSEMLAWHLRRFIATEN